MSRCFSLNSRNILILFFSLILSMCYGQEICNNAIDDDGDGLIDLNDSTDCICGLGTPSVVSSIIPNPSFETMSYCPNWYSQMDAATSWIQATGATADYMNTCDFIMTSLPVSLGLPFPDGNGIAGAFMLQDYKEYIGTCLSSPMIAGTPYKISLHIFTFMDNFGMACDSNTHGPVDISIFGSSSCSTLPLTGAYDCPSALDPSWGVLGVTNYTPSPTWEMITITFTPTSNINAIILGSPCTLPASYGYSMDPCRPYFCYDNLVLNESSRFGSVDVSSTGHYCSNNLVMTAHVTSTVTPSSVLQWYHDGIAIIGATGYTYSVPAGSSGLGDYQARLTDGSYCALSPIHEVTPTSPAISFNSPVICPGSAGILDAISICASYTWSTGASTHTISVSPSSTTSYTVIGSLGTCTTQATGLVTVLGNPTIIGNTTICAGESTHLSVSEGNMFIWSSAGIVLNDPFSDVLVETPSVTTTYSVTAILYMPPMICSTETVVTVFVSPAPTLSITPSTSSICAGSSVTLTALSSGPSTYTWSNGANSPSIVVSPTVNASFTASTSIGQCIGQDTALVIIMSPSITVNSPTICSGQTATLTANGASSYTWSNGSAANPTTVSPTVTTTYSIAGTNSLSCLSAAVLTVTVVKPIMVVNSPTICYGQSATLTASGASSYTWANGSTANPITVSPTVTTTYSISGTSGPACLVSATSTVSVMNPTADYSGITSQTVTSGTTLELTNTSTQATNYIWKGCDGSVLTSTNLSIVAGDTGLCCIELIAYQLACSDTITQCFEITPSNVVRIPNVFTPNGDGSNDLFKITSQHLKDLNCSIFNRWGLKMYEWSGVHGGWNGFTTSGSQANAGTYFFILNYTDDSDQTKTEKGFLTLIRD